MLLRKARSDVDSARKKFKVRLLEIESCRHADLQEKIQKAEELGEQE